jgi:hypothetical protein
LYASPFWPSSARERTHPIIQPLPASRERNIRIPIIRDPHHQEKSWEAAKLEQVLKEVCFESSGGDGAFCEMDEYAFDFELLV